MLALLLCAAFPVALPAGAQSVFTDRGLAIRGVDPVAYFSEARPVAGNPSITHDWMGATWAFATEANRAAFAADPAAYAPQYGGFCAWAVAEGYTAPIDPAAWTIVDGRLYLNYSRSVQRTWARDIPGNIARADANWPSLR
jgi:YHS domain-containing protein